MEKNENSATAVKAQNFTASVDEIEDMKRKVREMEEEANKLREMQAKLEEQQQESQEDVDSRSVYVGNVDYSTSPEELQGLFEACGQINRVTILCDKFTGHPKGFAYVEFAETSAVANALVLNESLFKNRVLQVSAKRTNVPGFMRGRGRGRGRASRGRFPRGRGRRPYHAPY